MSKPEVQLAWPKEVIDKYDAEALNALGISYKNASTIRRLLVEVLTNERERGRMALESESILDRPNPDQRRDWKFGYLAGLRYAMTLLTLTERNDHDRR